MAALGWGAVWLLSARKWSKQTLNARHAIAQTTSNWLEYCMIAAVIFDLDETLFDRSASLKEFVSCQFSNLEIGNFSDLRAVTARFIELDRRGRVSKREVYGKLLDEIGNRNEALVSELFDDYEANAWRSARPFDGMSDVIRTLKSAGKKIGIVSNGQTHIQLRSLLALNLDRLADAYLISEQVGCRKPDAAIFLKATKELCVPIGECVFVGDSPEADILGAHAAGMRTVWFPNGAEWPPNIPIVSDATIANLMELPPLIAQWDT